MTITLEAIKSDQQKLAEKIATFEAQQARTVTIPRSEIRLGDGEFYAGLITTKDGAPSHHLILLPGEAESLNWESAKTWASKAGGELPSRREQALLFANLKEQFQSAWYWSGEAYASDSACAWDQSFSNGNQSYDNVGHEWRVRAVRRLVIE